jgi:hypothetical protein
MLDYNKLLLNLEENIFHLLQKRNSRTNSLKKSTVKAIDNLSNSNEIIYDDKYILKNINIDFKYSKQIVALYFEKFENILTIDIDIVNLIVKYIDVCGKILKNDLIDTFGVRELNYIPSTTVKYLSSDYILNKYKGNYGWGISKEVLNDMHTIFLNFVIPFAERFMYSIYKI